MVNSWIEHWGKVPNVVEIDSPTITPESVLVASGHVGEFNDKMSECKSCGGAFRSDHLLVGLHENPGKNPAKLPPKALAKKVATVHVVPPMTK